MALLLAPWLHETNHAIPFFTEPPLDGWMDWHGRDDAASADRAHPDWPLPLKGGALAHSHALRGTLSSHILSSFV